MVVYMEEYLQAFHEDDMFLEDTAATYEFKEKLYPRVEAILSTPEGNRKFRTLVREFIDRNSAKLNTQGPIYVVAFGPKDKEPFFEMFSITQKEIVTVVTDVTKVISGSHWLLVRQNPIFLLFYCAIRYYSLQKDETGVNTALAIYALAAYPSVMHKYFQYGANPSVMQFTIDNMSDKFMIKQSKTVFGMLCLSINNSYKFLMQDFVDMKDALVLKFIQRIRNDQNSLMKKIKSEFMKNYNNKNAIYTLNDNFGDGEDMNVDVDNDSTIVEKISNKVILGMLSSGLDLTRVEAAAKISGISVSECRSQAIKIFTDRNTESIRSFVEAVLYIYIFMEHHKRDEIRSGGFLIWSSALFRRTNAKDDNVVRIKTTLDTWGDISGIHSKYKGETTRNLYKKAIFMYLIFTIQRFV